MYILLLDTSGSWEFIAAVVVRSIPRIYCSHIAGIPRDKREKIINDVLKFIATNGYAVCVRALIHLKVRAISFGGRKNKARLWRNVLRSELYKIANHLRDVGYWPIDVVYADREFEGYMGILEEVFRLENVYVEKTDKLCLADTVAYLNFRDPKRLRGIKNIREID